MKDKIIISAISKTYFIIVSFLSFIFLLLTYIFIILQNGLYLENISLSTVDAKKVYIKWNQNIDITIDTLNINTQHKSTNTQFDNKKIKKIMKIVSQTTHWFDSVIIKNIKIDDIEASFIYRNNEEGTLHIVSQALQADASLFMNSNILNIDITNFKDLKKNITASGKIYFDISSIDLYTQLDFNINNDVNLTLFSVVNMEKLKYKVISNHKIVNTKNIIETFPLPKEVRYWVLDAIKMDYLTISDIHGFIEFKNMKDTLQNIYVHATAEKLNYKYNPQLDAIHSQKTELEFKNGVLYIKPQDTYTYGMFLDKSWLKIDFTKKEELLSLYLLFNGVVNKDLLKILNTYKIKLPFEQKKGVIATNLNIIVNLITISVDAKGEFYTKEANFDYLGLNLDIYDSYISLDNYDAEIKSMKASYKNIANANVNMKYNAKENKGKINFLINKINMETFSLDTSKKPLSVSYTISPSQDYLDIKNSVWSFNNKNFFVDAISIPFDINTLALSIPTTYLTYDNIGSAFVSGSANLKNFQTNLYVDILNLSYKGVKLSQSNTPLQVKYDNKLSLHSKDPIFFDVSGTSYKVDKLALYMDKEEMSLQNTYIHIGNYVTTKIYSKYNRKTKKAHVSLSDFTLTSYNKDKVFYKKKKIMLGVELNKDNIKVNSSELDAQFILDDDKWNLSLNSIGRIAQNSPILQSFHINSGSMLLEKKNSDKYTQFTSSLIYPYKILMENETPTNRYKINGKINKDKIYFKINNKVNVKINSNVKITVNKAGINVDELLRLADDANSSQNNPSQKVTLNAKNSYLSIGKDRSIVFDNFDLQYSNKILTAQLQHQKGKAGLRIDNNELNLYGQNFNDYFMERLFAHSKFMGGDLDFIISGTLDNYSGLFHIKDSTILDYRLLNNILAFVNTVPSLVTFSLPGYSKNGLFVKQAYTNFNANDGIFNLSDIFLDSKELTILGKGIVDTKANNVDINLNLKTDLGSDLSKVPVVGYILLGKDSISTTLEIKGDLSNPSVKSLIAKEIVVAPLNIIKRTLTLPLKLFDFSLTDTNNSE